MENFDYYVGMAFICAIGLCVFGFAVVSLFRFDGIGIVAGVAMLYVVRMMANQQRNDFKRK